MDKPELKKILYAEDEPDIRQIATLAFEAMGGFEVVTCETGETVVERAHAFQPDLVVLDVMMPGVDGPGAMGALRQTEEFQDTPMVFMTAKVMPAELERFKQLGALDVITPSHSIQPPYVISFAGFGTSTTKTFDRREIPSNGVACSRNKVLGPLPGIAGQAVASRSESDCCVRTIQQVPERSGSGSWCRETYRQANRSRHFCIASRANRRRTSVSREIMPLEDEA